MVKKLSRTGVRRYSGRTETGRGEIIQVPLTDANIDDLNAQDARDMDIPDRDLRVQVPVYRSGRSTPTMYTNDFGPLVEQYPHHETLVKHLILGTELYLKRTSLATVSSAYAGIRTLVEFLNDGQWVTVSTVRTVADLGLDVCVSFRSYLLKTYPSRWANVKHYRAVRGAVRALQEAYSSHESIGGRKPWPVAPAYERRATEAYSLDVFQKLVACCVEDIRAIMAAHEHYEDLVAHGERLRADDITLENVMWWLTYASPNIYGRSITKVKELQWLGEFCTANDLSIDDLLALHHDQGDELAARGANPFGTRIAWERATNEERVRNLDLAAATLAAHFPAYPFHLSLVDVRGFYKDAGRRTIAGHEGEFETKLAATIRLSRASHGIETGIGAYFSYIHWTSDTLFPFFLFLELQMGWNPQSLLALPADLTGNAHDIPDDLEDLTPGIAPDMIDPQAATLIASIKRQADGRNGPKLVLHRSYKGDPFGAFAMLTYISEKVTAYGDSPHYLPGTLWQYIHDPTWWSRTGSLLGTFTDNHKSLRRASAAFLKRHSIEGIKGPRGMEDVINSRRVRSTYASLRFMEGKDVADIQQDLDHASGETTDTNYLSDDATVEEKNRALFPVLVEWADDLTNQEPVLTRSLTYEKLRENILAASRAGEAKKNEVIDRYASALGVRREDVVHIISGDGDTYIIACRNARAPTWPGHEEAVRPGKKCGAFNKCCLCKQAIIFADSLPYIARRILDIESFTGPTGLNSVDWAAAYGNEVAAWREILARWEQKGPVYKEQVDEAWRTAYAGDVVLPTLMRVWR